MSGGSTAGGALRRRHRLALLLLLALAALGPRSAPAAVSRHTLPNGLRVVLVANPIAPVSTTVVNYLVGSVEAPPGFPGTAHAQEHMMFRGSPGLSADELAAITAGMGGMFNADTQQTVTQYFFTVPAADLEVALHLEAIRMRGVLDAQKLWLQERGAIEQEVAQDLSDPEFVFYTKLLADMFRSTPYAYSPLGTVASFDSTTAARLKTFYDSWYAPNNAILVVAGAIDTTRTLADIKELFGPIPRRVLPARPAVHLEPVAAQRLQLPTDAPYGMVVVSFRFPGYDSPDYPAARLLADALNSQRGRLYELTASGKALATGFAASILPEAGLGMAIAAFPRGADAQALLQKVQEVLTRSVTDSIPADLVAAAQRREQADAEMAKNSVSGLAMAWSQALAVEGRQSPQDDVEAMARVTVGEVNRAARRYLDQDRAVIAILTPESSGKPVSGKGLRPAESIALTPAGSVTLPTWAADDLQRLAVPTSSVEPSVSQLDNGIRLIVQRESVSSTVGVYGHIRNQPDLQEPEGQEGVDRVLAQLFTYGTETLDRLAFQAALDEIAAEVSAGTSFSLEVLTDHFDRGVQLLADDQLHPALPEDAFQIVRGQVAATVAGELESPGYLAGRALAEGIYPAGDPALRQATPASVSSLTLSQVRDYYRQVFRPDETIIVVIGEVTPEQAKKTIEKYFGAWQATGPRPDLLLPAIPTNPPATVAVPDARRVQDEVTLAQALGGMTRKDPDYYALVLGNHVLGGGFYASRLYRQLREEKGLVYHVGVQLDAGRSRAIYSVDYACDPGSVEKAREIVVRNLERMRTEAVGEQELDQAREMLLRQLPLAEASLSDIAQGLLSRARLGLPLDEPTRAARRYLELSGQEVREAFARRLQPADLVQVSQGPTPR